MNSLLYCICFFGGCIFGSFLNVVILRLPEGKTLSGRSQCVKCGHTLSPWELLPLISFLVLGARCSHCKAPISWRYFFIEAITGLLFVLVWYFFSPQGSAISYLLFIKNLMLAVAFLAIFVIDLEHFLILDSVVYPSLAIVTILNILIAWQQHMLWSWSGSFLNGIVGMFVAGLFFFAIWFISKGTWMGFGDVKLSLLLGAAFGWPLVAVSVMSGVFLGGIISVFLLASGKKGMKSQLPFGTFLAVGSVVTMFYGSGLLSWYLRLIGL